mgnify:CR=1 FL=1
MARRRPDFMCGTSAGNYATAELTIGLMLAVAGSAAGAPPLEGISSRSLADGIRATGHPSATAIDSPSDIAVLVRRYARPGDIVVCLGAGNSTEWAHALPEQLAGEARVAGGTR